MNNYINNSIHTYPDTPEISEAAFGAVIRQFRIRKGYSLEEVADRAGLSPTSVRSLELGRGSTVGTMLKVLATIGETGLITEWAARNRKFSPMAAFKASQRQSPEPQRVGRVRRRAAAPGGVPSDGLQAR
ncbi:MAG: helix-turn-helix transcriptional regulator [Clostridiales Family XIII bacterium]|jgi:transcriptional regulator with XRE-family HTH domain|nr:helix-turn-helix transcriptional regulator [Clostridiales Family XIII bacterium]